MNALKLKLKTITPVSVRDGGILSSISDFFIENSKVYYINKNKLNEFFTIKPEMIDRYIDLTLNKIDNNRADIDVKKDILQNLMKVNPYDYVYEPLACYGLENNSKIQINTIIKSAGKPFIPGSSIKGSIKTALLYDWLMNDEEGKKWLISFVKILDSKDLKKDKIFKDVDKLLKKYAIKENENKEEFVKLFKISDTDSTVVQNIGIYKTAKIHLTNKSKQGMIPNVTEAILPNIELNFCYHNEVTQFDKITQTVNKFYSDVLKYEEDIIQNTYEGIIPNNMYNKVLDHYEDLSEKFEYNTNKNIYLRIGSGKSNFNNSIGLTIYANDLSKKKELFNKFRKIFNIGEEDSHFFPLTRTNIVFNNTQPGWVEFSKIEEKEG
jgi:CRISPR-associated protein Csm5